MFQKPRSNFFTRNEDDEIERLALEQIITKIIDIINDDYNDYDPQDYSFYESFFEKNLGNKEDLEKIKSKVLDRVTKILENTNKLKKLLSRSNEEEFYIGIEEISKDTGHKIFLVNNNFINIFFSKNIESKVVILENITEIPNNSTKVAEIAINTLYEEIDKWLSIVVKNSIEEHEEQMEQDKNEERKILNH